LANGSNEMWLVADFGNTRNVRLENTGINENNLSGNQSLSTGTWRNMGPGSSFPYYSSPYNQNFMSFNLWCRTA